MSTEKEMGMNILNIYKTDLINAPSLYIFPSKNQWNTSYHAIMHPDR